MKETKTIFLPSNKNINKEFDFPDTLNKEKNNNEENENKKFHPKENKKNCLNKKIQFEFFNLIFIFIVSIISNSNCFRKIKLKDSIVTLKISGTGEQNIFRNGSCTWPDEIYVNNNLKEPVYYTYDLNKGDIVKLVWKHSITNCGSMFKNCTTIVEMNFTNFDTSLCSNMGNMFYDCESLTSLDLSSFDTSNVEQIHSMFFNCHSLISLNLNNLNTLKIHNMGHMFNNCTSIESIDLSSFNSSNTIRSLDNMFKDCKNLIYVNLSNIDTSNVNNISYIFSGCVSLTSIDFHNLNIASIPYMENMFYNCDNLGYLNLKNFVPNSNLDLNFLSGTSKNLVIYTTNEILTNKLKNDKCIVANDLENWYIYRKQINLEDDKCYHICIITNFKFEYNNKCYKSCLQESEPYNEICIESFKDEPGIYDILLKNVEKEFNSKYYDTMKLDNGFDEIFDFFELKITLTTTKNQEKGKKIGNQTNIDLNECETELKKAYNISFDDILYIKKIDVIEDGMKIPKIEYNIYSKLNGSNLIKLNLSYCTDIKIDLYIPVNLTEDLDKHNSSSGYYNDICYSSSSDTGTDIILSDRKNEFIENNKTICQENCVFTEYNHTINQAKCKCTVQESSKFFSDMKIDKKKLLDNFVNVKNFMNINILFCYNELFSKKGLLKNYGSYSMIVIIITHIIIIIIICAKSYINKLKEIIFQISNNYIELSDIDKKSVKINRKSKKNKSKKVNDIQIKKVKTIKSNKFSTPQIKKQKNVTIISDKSKNIYNINKRKKEKNNNSKNKSVSFSNIELSKKNNTSTLKSKKIISYNDAELNGLSYESAIINDKRNFCQYYFSLFKAKHELIFSFFTSNDYNLKIIKIDLFFFDFAFSFEINALFFTDGTMHKIYEDKGSFNFIYQLPQIIYSMLISNFIDILIKMLALSEDDIINFKEKISNKDLKLKSADIYKKIRIKIIFYFILSSILLLAFWYYIGMFCAIYANTQIHLIKDTIIGFILSLIYPFGLYFIPAICRISALSEPKSKRKYLYKVSQFIENIF